MSRKVMGSPRKCLALCKHDLMFKGNLKLKHSQSLKE